MILRVLPHLTADGPRQMALDEALLDSVSSQPDAAVVRTYAWSEPTLSLGYFQSIAEVEADPRWQGVPLVRRSTGGGAIWHDREITYAVVLPRTHAVTRHPATLYETIHAACRATLAVLGVATSRRGDAHGPPLNPRPFLCFADRDPDDIVLGAQKVVGSAQRRRPHACLQHGSVLWSRSSLTPELPGISDLVTESGPMNDWIDQFPRRLAVGLALELVADAWRVDEQQRASELEAAAYRHDAWKRKR
jgi:lipoate-protein ligase A